jgi:amino acid transporter
VEVLTKEGDFVADEDHRQSDSQPAAREEFGGVNWGAAFFGWLVAIGLGAILTALASAAGAAFGLTSVSPGQASQQAATVGIVGAVILLIVLAIAYYAGGYVAGRMSRFDGGRQGVAVWVIGLVITILIAIAGAIFGAQYNVLASLNLPSIPTSGSSLAGGAAITLMVILGGTFLAAMVGGKAGRRYHHKVDRMAQPR